MPLNEKDILQILNIVESSSFDLLELQVGDLKLTARKNAANVPAAAVASSSGQSEANTSAAPAHETAPAQTQEESAAVQAEQKAASPAASTTKETDAGQYVPILSPMVGVFYIAPEPGAEPYVKEGSVINEETTVGLIEVMKVFTAVKSELRGVIVERCVQNGELVEFGQPLFLVKPGDAEDGASA